MTLKVYLNYGSENETVTTHTVELTKKKQRVTVKKLTLPATAKK